MKTPLIYKYFFCNCNCFCKYYLFNCESRGKRGKKQFLHYIHFFSLLGSELNKQLEGWLNAADLSHGPARAIIAP